MFQTEPSFTIGIEEEYLLVDPETLDLVAAPAGLMEACQSELGEKASPEFLQCQLEVGTGVCSTISHARADLRQLRRKVKTLAEDYGVAPIAASTHPFAKWHDQSFTDKDRYRDLERDLAGVARRMLICGMHVHVGIDDDELRIALMSQFRYFLPPLLALSGSSPFWEGDRTGLRSYRLTVFDNLPRTGLPPRFANYRSYRDAVDAIIATGAIEDASKIWWDLRPSEKFPTLESRICDMSPRMEDALSMAAVTQSLFRMLWASGRDNLRWRDHERVLLQENRWRAMRYGTTEGLIDFGSNEVKSMPVLADELIALLTPHATELGCLPEVQRIADIARRGSSAERQMAVFDEVIDEGRSERDALRAVVSELVREFSEGL